MHVSPQFAADPLNWKRMPQQPLVGMDLTDLREALGPDQPGYRARQIVGQVLRVARENQLRREGGRLNIVMMGQGEPLLNLPNVVKATRILLDPAGFALSPRRITVSTAGIIPKIAELGREPVRPRLAISLNASTEEQRQELMPITRKYHLKDLLAACKDYPLRPRANLTVEYVLLKTSNPTNPPPRRAFKLLA